MKYLYLAILFLLISCTSKFENQNIGTQQLVPFIENTQEELKIDELLTEPLILDGRPFKDSNGKVYEKEEAYLIESLFCNFTSDAIVRWHSFDGIEQLFNLKYLTIYGEIPNTVDMRPVSSLYNLEELLARNLNRLPDLTRLERLSTIVINVSQLETLEGIGAPNVRRISISNKKEIGTFAPLNNLLYLEELYIHSTGKDIYRIADMSNLPSLKSLELVMGVMLDLQGIENLQTLEALHLLWSGSYNLEGIGKLTNLKELYLYLISPKPSLEFLRGMPNLEDLCLNAKGGETYRVLDLAPLASLKKLENLKCDNFIVKNISALDALNTFVYSDEGSRGFIDLVGSKLFDETEKSKHQLLFEILE